MPKVFPEIIIKNDSYWEVFEVCKKSGECNDIAKKLHETREKYSRWAFRAMAPRPSMLDEVPDLLGIIYKKIEPGGVFLFNIDYAVVMD